MQVKDKVLVCTLDGKKCKEVLALFDSGSRRTYIDEEVAEELGFDRYPEPRHIQLAVKGRKALAIGSKTYDFVVAGYKMPLSMGVEVVRELVVDVIIGTDFMEAFEIELDLTEGKVRLKRSPPEAYLI